MEEINISAPLFTIIVPAYNEEKHIAQCLDSLVGQSIAPQLFEVIVVDDASTDSTASIVSKYAQTYNNIILLQHAANRNQGAARNTAIKAAGGDYLIFVDADDKIYHADALAYLKGILQHSDLQVLLCGNNMPHELTVMTGCDYISTHPGFGVQVWDNVYKTSYIKSCPPFVEGHYYEDTRWSTEVIYNASRLGIIGYDYYQYQQYSSSTTRSITDKRIIDNALSNIETRRFADACPMDATCEIIYRRIVEDVLSKPYACRMHSYAAIKACYHLYAANNMFKYPRVPLGINCRIKLYFLSIKPISILLACTLKVLYSAKLRLLEKMIRIKL